MKKSLVFLCAAALFFGLVASAGATTFTLDSYTVNYNNEDPGLVLYTEDILSQPATADLDVNHGPYNFALFTIGTNEKYVNRDDRVDQDISVSFNFSAPDSVSGNVTGESDGHMRFLADDKGSVDWNDPAMFNYGNGGQFSIRLYDVCFGTPGSATVYASLDFISESSPVAPVPEPATIFLMGAGLIGVLGYNRKSFTKKS